MVSRNALYVADRAFRELRRDVRTMTLFIISPALVMIVLSGVLHNYPQTWNRTGLLVMGLFPTAPSFLFAAFMVHRERYRGTLEYLLTTPTQKLDVLVGYLIAFMIPSVVQVGLSLTVTYQLLGFHVAGAWWALGLLALLNSALGVALGLFVTNLVRNEFQLVLTLGAIALPHLMLSGLFRSPNDMVGWMHAISDFLPWHYSVGAAAELQKHASATSALWFNVAVTVGFIFVLSTIIANTVFSRRSA